MPHIHTAPEQSEEGEGGKAGVNWGKGWQARHIISTLGEKTKTQSGNEVIQQ